MKKVIKIRKVRDPYLSVIVPTLNGSKLLERCLRSIRRQNYKDFELIVSDGDSDDETLEIVRKFADSIIISDHRSTSTQQNNGASIARGKVLVFVHQDVVLFPNYLSTVRMYSKTFNVGKSLFSCESNIVENLYRLVSRLIDILLEPLNFTSGANQFFVRADDFRKSGGLRRFYFWDLDLFRKVRKYGKICLMKETSCILVFNISMFDLLKKSLNYLFYGLLDVFGYHRKA